MNFLPQYAARAIVDLERYAKTTGSSPYSLAVKGAISFLRNGVHVILPSNGEIYRGNFAGGAMPNQDEQQSLIGLPAPVTCFQYAWTHPKKGPDEGCRAPKRITIVYDLKQNGDPAVMHDYLVFFSVFYDETSGIWQLADAAIYLVSPFIFNMSNPPRGEWDWNMLCMARNLVSGEPLDQRQQTLHGTHLGQFRPDITAVIQCCHSLRAGARLEERTEQSRARRKKFNHLGVGGMVYHELVVPSAGKSIRSGECGTHSSPRLHVRRSHIRKLPTGAFTFVRQCLVGDASRGIVEKHYRVAP